MINFYYKTIDYTHIVYLLTYNRLAKSGQVSHKDFLWSPRCITSTANVDVQPAFAKKG